MYLLAIILFMVFITIFFVVTLGKLLMYKKQIQDITSQIKEFRERRTNKKISTQTVDKCIGNLAFEINEYLELYKKNEQEKIVFENTLKQGIANMSHDLRTPLTSIIGYLRLLENDEINKEDALKIIKNKTNRLNILINDFFELSFIESEDYELELKKVNLSNILSDEILSFYQAFEDKGIQPKINISNEPLFINGDKESLERIVDNLISNTLKYAEKNLEINLEECDGTIILKIANKCTSIDEKDVLHIFDRFYMADKVRKGEGTGLGLSIVKALMEKMNGVIKSKFEKQIITIICEWKRVN